MQLPLAELGQDDESFEVEVDAVLFESSDGRFVVLRATRVSNGEELTAVGDLGGVAVGETLRVRGRFTTHERYGRRLRVQGFTPIMPSTAEGIARYLGSGMVPGVGKGIAKKLVAKFGADTIEIIARQSSRLQEVEGIGKARAERIANAIRQRRGLAEQLSFLHGAGLGPATARRIIERYGDDSIRLVRDDPYLVAEQVRGVGFRTADRVGRALGIGADDPRRAAGAILHLLAQGADSGHVYLPLAEIRSRARELDIPSERIDEALPELERQRLVCIEGEAIYAPPLLAAEDGVASVLQRLAAKPARTSRKATPTTSNLSSAQIRAVERSLRHRLLVLTGGPGTGKTTTVGALVAAHEAAARRVLLCAPTGRAAKRLAEATGHDARTIHRALEWNPGSGRFLRNEQYPLDADTILVDEASMLDVRLAHDLLRALPDDAHLILVGDIDQLPPVGPGQVLRDLIDSEIAPVERLREVFRQAKRSAIVRGAHALLEGRLPDPTPTGERGDGDLFIVADSSPQRIVARLGALLRRIPEAYGLDPKRDVQVLSPMRKGPLGTEALNEALQGLLNPEPNGKSGQLRPGDRVMQLRNDYDKDVFNGDLGEVRHVGRGALDVLIDGRLVRYGRDDESDLSLAYACTIHKVQGSELPAVIVIMHSSHAVMLNRPLLYTALTRAKQLVILLGERKAMQLCARRSQRHQIFSCLSGKLRASSNVGMPTNSGRATTSTDRGVDRFGLDDSSDNDLG